jgi:lysozyme
MISLKEQLMIDEGRRLTAYRCPAGRLTIGVGHNLDASPNFNGKPIPHVIDVELCDAILCDDIQKTKDDLKAAWPYFAKLGGIRRQCMINMAFQMGVHGLMKFRQKDGTGMLDAIERDDWAEAAKEAQDSKWYKQSGNRSRRIVKQILNGV